MAINKKIYIYFSDKAMDKTWIAGFSNNLAFSLKKVTKVDFPIHLIDEHAFSGETPQITLEPEDLLIAIMHSSANEDHLFHSGFEILCDSFESEENEVELGKRIFKVLLSPSDKILQPNCLKNLEGYHFFEVIGRNKVLQIFDITTKNPKAWAKLLDLVYDIKDKSNHVFKSNQQNSSFTVYLGSCSSDQVHNRDDIKRELLRLGVKVLPKTILPDSHTDFKDIVEKNLASSNLVVQITGGNYGEVNAGERYSSFDFENKLIRDYFNVREDIARLIWTPEDIKILDQRQELLLKRIKKEESDFNSEIIEASLEEFKTIVSQRIGAFQSNHKNVEYKDNVYFISKPRIDLSSIIAIADQGNVKIDRIDPLKEESLYHQHLRFLGEVDNLIIHYTDNDSAWLNSKIKDIIRALGTNRKVKFNSIGIISKSMPDISSYSTWLGEVTHIESENNESLKGFFKTLG